MSKGTTNGKMDTTNKTVGRKPRKANDKAKAVANTSPARVRKATASKPGNDSNDKAAVRPRIKTVRGPARKGSGVKVAYVTLRPQIADVEPKSGGKLLLAIYVLIAFVVGLLVSGWL